MCPSGRRTRHRRPRSHRIRGRGGECRRRVADAKQRTAALGRDPHHWLIFFGAAPVIAGTDAEAHRLSREIFDADNVGVRTPSAAAVASSCRTWLAPVVMVSVSPQAGTDDGNALRA